MGTSNFETKNTTTQKMKICNVFALATAAYGQGYNNGGGNTQLVNRIEKAVTKCMVYMEKSLTCDPPASKISKYTHRLSAVFLDTVHHLNVGKCEPRSAGGYTAYRKRRSDDDLDAEFDALMNEVEDEGFTGKQKKVTQQQLNKFAKLCNQSTDAVLDSDELADCNKLGAWKNRAAHLLNDINIMRNVCKNQDAAKPSMGY